MSWPMDEVDEKITQELDNFHAALLKVQTDHKLNDDYFGAKLDEWCVDYEGYFNYKDARA